jgi:hypothetical protein
MSRVVRARYSRSSVVQRMHFYVVVGGELAGREVAIEGPIREGLVWVEVDDDPDEVRGQVVDEDDLERAAS